MTRSKFAKGRGAPYRLTGTVPFPTIGTSTIEAGPRLMSVERGRSSPLTYRYESATPMSLVIARSNPRLACWTFGLWKSGSNTKIVGLGIAAPEGIDGNVFGYVGTWLPVNVIVRTLMPLFECAVPT